jgi:hypothetical protein
MDSDNVTKLICNIEKAWDKKTGEELDLTCVKFEKRREDDLKPEVYRFIHNDTVYNRKNNVVMRYRCITCDRVNMCALNNVVQRVNRGYVWCKTCKDFVDSPDQSMQDKIALDRKEFALMPEDSQAAYWSRYLTLEEFNKFKPFILSLQKERITNLTGYEYIECASMNGGRHNFMPYLYHGDNEAFERIIDLRLQCEQCGDEFLGKDLKRHKGKSRMLCLACTANMPFCIKDKPHENIAGATVHHKTRYEAKFLRFCNKHDMEVNNGIDLVYPWLHHQIQYRVPYFIKQIGLLVDIKDNHQWRSEDGMNAAKTAARKRTVQEYISAHPDIFTGYVVLYPGNYVKETRNMVTVYHHMTSFRAWRKTKKDAKLLE